jgi:sulfur carrier protein
MNDKLMTVYVNSSPKQLREKLSVRQALLDWGSDDTGIAIALNECFLPKSLYAETLLQAGDRLELLTPMQGG